MIGTVDLPSCVVGIFSMLKIYTDRQTDTQTDRITLLCFASIRRSSVRKPSTTSLPCSKLNYLARSVSPSLSQSTAAINDNLTQRTFCKILGVPPIVEDRWKKATLPIKLGGFGMTSVDAIASSAFLGGWMHTLSNLPTRFPYLTSNVSLLLSTDNISKISFDIHQAVKSTGCDYCQHLSEFVKQPKKLQQKLSSQLHEANANSCQETVISQSDRAAAKCRSISGKGAGSWLEAIPTEEILALKPNKFCLAASLRLDIPAHFVNWNIQCECGKLADEYHLLTCKHGGGSVWQHDEIVNAWSTSSKDSS